MNAKDLINGFYQPLGFLKCGVSSDQMWEYAKQRAIEHLTAMIAELEQLHKPEYTTFITSMEKGESQDGYERIDYYETLKTEVESL